MSGGSESDLNFIEFCNFERVVSKYYSVVSITKRYSFFKLIKIISSLVECPRNVCFVWTRPPPTIISIDKNENHFFINFFLFIWFNIQLSFTHFFNMHSKIENQLFLVISSSSALRMKLSTISIVLTLVFQVFCNHRFLVFHAINRILHEFFVPNSLKVDVVYVSDGENLTSEKLVLTKF